jgi:2,3-bisphosphoglycerate-dependent phosphoglycerate mutase
MNHVVYLVRHCQATGQEADAPLTELGQLQAFALSERLCKEPISRIISSPFTRAYQSILPLATSLKLTIELDTRLTERVLSLIPLANWRELLAQTFIDLDLCVEGGESSRTAMMRGVAVVNQLMHKTTGPGVVVTHGNLMTLMLKHFNEQIGFAEWASLRNPDVYRIRLNSEDATPSIDALDV